MLVWVYRARHEYVEEVTVSNVELTPEEFARQWQDYFPEDIYFFAELVSL